MSPSSQGGGRLKACRDRCEVCNTVLIERPVANRRRCADHLDQLVLIPDPLVRKSARTTGQEEGSR
jgi:hypothetical protein